MAVDAGGHARRGGRVDGRRRVRGAALGARAEGQDDKAREADVVLSLGDGHWPLLWDGDPERRAERCMRSFGRGVGYVMSGLPCILCGIWVSFARDELSLCEMMDVAMHIWAASYTQGRVRIHRMNMHMRAVIGKS
jgi:hypothetical protein